jgi:hypothetical protein
MPHARVNEKGTLPMTRGKKIVSGVLIALVAVVLIFVGVVAMQPADYRIVRSAMMNAPADVVFAQVNDFHKWDAWSPWAKLDPAAKNTFDGPPAGAGAGFAWSGNKDVGEGRMTITESRPNELVRIKLDFFKPMEGTCTTEFAFAPAGEGATNVTWTMAGRNSFVEKAFCLFMDMDKMVGGDFEKGLAQMRSVAEAAARK